MKAYVGEDEHFFLISALAGDEWSASRSGRFNPGKEPHNTLWIGGWVDPRAGLDDVEHSRVEGGNMKYLFFFMKYFEKCFVESEYKCINPPLITGATASISRLNKCIYFR
jgi:hypothetical protein